MLQGPRISNAVDAVTWCPFTSVASSATTILMLGSAAVASKCIAIGTGVDLVQELAAGVTGVVVRIDDDAIQRPDEEDVCSRLGQTRSPGAMTRTRPGPHCGSSE